MHKTMMTTPTCAYSWSILAKSLAMRSYFFPFEAKIVRERGGVNHHRTQQIGLYDVILRTRWEGGPIFMRKYLLNVP